MDSDETRKSKLYGPDRNLRVEAIRRNLSKSCVLRDGEYNLTTKGLSKSVFGTSYETDFPVRTSVFSTMQVTKCIYIYFLAYESLGFSYEIMPVISYVKSFVH